MPLRLPRLLAALLAFTQVGCGAATGPGGPPLRFEVRAAPPERSAVYAVTAERTPEGVVVRGGFFVGVPERALSARVVRVGPTASRLEVSAVPGPATGGQPAAAHFDYEAVLPAAPARILTVVHLRAGATGADTVFRGRVY
jgi:hypothetical protein